MKNKKIAIILGTKAELIKCMPVMLELQARKEPYLFIHTGQHPLGEICENFKIKKPDVILSKEPDKETKFWSKINNSSIFWIFSTILKIKKEIKKENPNYVIYHGDTMSTFSAAIGSSKLLSPFKSWKNIHLEAGLRSGRLFEPFPEEISRRFADRFSDILLAVSNETEKFLIEKYPNKIVINVGNTIIDTAQIIYNQIKKEKRKNDLRIKNYVLINIHRHENIKNKKRLSKIVEIINSIKTPIIWPLHKNTEFYLKKYNLLNQVLNNKKIKIIPLTDYKRFISLMIDCKYIITDGGSIQEESLIFKKPCVIMRETTERQEGLETGINFLTKLDVEKTKRLIERLDNKEIKIKNFNNPYGKKGLTKKIVDLLLK
jgi:UDP-N-acetylglucosamine 2-epimerase (non-hydrolysing)